VIKRRHWSPLKVSDCRSIPLLYRQSPCERRGFARFFLIFTSGNSERTQYEERIELGKSFQTAEVADEIHRVRTVSVFRGTPRETNAKVACYNRRLSPRGAIV
jgi:hypothetical protein